MAVEDIIDARSWHNRYPSILEANLFSNNKKKGKFLDESHKDYESDLESIRDLFEEWGLRIPNQWLPEDEAEDRMWDEFDQSRCDAADLGPYDFDCFRFDIDKSFYDSSKVWNEETLPRLEREKKWRADNDC